MSRTTRPSDHRSSWQFFVVALAALSLFAILPAQCRAQDRPTPSPTPTIDPTPTPIVTPTPIKSTTPYGTPANYAPRQSVFKVRPGQPSPTPLPQRDQPPVGDPQYGETIQWVVYAPPSGMMGPDGTAHWPIVVVLHIGGFKSGDFYNALGGSPEALANAGFYVVVAGYPLAPPNNIPGQFHLQQLDPDHSGRYPQQTRAVEAIIDAAKRDPNCYHGLVGVLGGSGGASHAAYVALDVTDTSNAWPYWSFSARPKCVVCLSGQYDFSDREQDVIDEGNFIPDIENYTYTTIPMTQWQDSPIGLVAAAAQHQPFIPMYCLRASADPGSPKSNSDDFWYTMTQAGATPPTFFMWEVPEPSMDHAFSLWNDYTEDNPDVDYLVQDRAIAFFKQYLHD